MIVILSLNRMPHKIAQKEHESPNNEEEMDLEEGNSSPRIGSSAGIHF